MYKKRKKSSEITKKERKMFFEGETKSGVSRKKYWEERLEEPTHISAHTGKPLSGMQIFAPMQHVRKADGRCGRISREDF